MTAILTVASCTPSTSPDVYSRGEVKTAQRLDQGEVVYVRQVAIEGTSTAGTIAGGVMGYVLGGTIGAGSGRDVARAGGAIAGAAAGGAAERGVTAEKGLEITVELDSGESVVVVQGADVPFTAGDRVRVIRRTDGAARVVQ